MWYVLFTAVVTLDFVQRSSNELRIVALAWMALASFVLILVFAHPMLREVLTIFRAYPPICWLESDLHVPVADCSDCYRAVKIWKRIDRKSSHQDTVLLVPLSHDRVYHLPMNPVEEASGKH